MTPAPDAHNSVHPDDVLPYPKDKYGRYLVPSDWERPLGFRGRVFQNNWGIFISADYSGEKERDFE